MEEKNLCKICNIEFIKKNYKQICCNKECSKKHGKMYIKQYGIRNKEYLKEYNKKLKLKYKNNPIKRNREKELERIRVNKKYIENLEYKKRKKLEAKQYRQLHHQEVLEREKLRKLKNREINLENLAYRYKNDIDFRLRHQLAHRIKYLIKRKEINNIKYHKTLELLGCSIIEFKEHLEKQFKEGMNWNNHKKFGWHIDHIIPTSSFDLSKEEEQKKCFHYINLQPLWWYDNLEKSNKILEVKNGT